MQIYQNSTGQTKIETLGPPFAITKGVKQRDPISPDLFNCALKCAIRTLEWENEHGVKINGQYLTHLKFPDDLILVTTSAQSLHTLLEELNTTCKKIGLNINYEETKIITNGQT